VKSDIEGAAWKKVRLELERLMDLEPDARASALRDLRASDPQTAARVESLLDRTESATAGLEPESNGAWSAVASEVGMRDPSPGERVGRFELVRLIGSGGMGLVYEARDLKLGRTVALKLLHLGLEQEQAVRRLEHEAACLAKLRHPGVAQVYDIGQWHATGASIDARPVPFIAMELVVDAVPITHYAVAGRLGLDARLTLFASVLEAVHEAHQRGVIHRDLKPGNVLVSLDGRAKVIDFGISHVQGQVTQTLASAGTLRFMSPESLGAGGDAGVADARADLYSLGVLLHELIEDRSPFEHADGPVGPLLDEIRGGRLQPMRLTLAENAATRADLRAVILKAMAIEPRDRYESVAAFARDVERVRRCEPISIRPPGPLRDLRLFVKRNRVLATSLAVAALALATGATLATVGLVHARRSLATARLESERATRTATFLGDMLNVVKPSLPVGSVVSISESWMAGRPEGDVRVPQGNGPRMADALRWAAGELDARFADDPLLRAKLAMDLSSWLASVYDVEQLPRLVAGAARTFRDLRGLDDDQTLRAEILSTMLGGSDLDRAKAAELWKRSCELHGQADERSIAALKAYCFLLISGSRWEEAVRACDQALARLPDAEARTGRFGLSIRFGRAHALLSSEDESRHATGLRECEALIVDFERLEGRDSDSAAYARFELATQLRTADPAGAESLLLDARRVLVETRGVNSPLMYELNSGLSDVLLRQSKLEAAEACVREQLRYAVMTFGDEAYSTCKAKGRLARVLTWAGRSIDEALDLAEQAAKDSLKYEERLPYGDFQSYFAAVAADALREKGDATGAERRVRALLAMRVEHGRTSWTEPYLHYVLAQSLADQHRWPEAQAEVAEAVAAAKVLDAGHPMVLSIHQCEARVAARR
jgi:eukaryotic-like serine/threonine-protein kinase